MMRYEIILEKFLNHLDLEQGYSINTIKTYKLILQKFGAYIKLRKVKKKNIESFVVHLKNENKNSAKSIRLKLAVLKSFFKYATEKLKIYRISPFGEDDFRYKVERKDVKSLSEKQIKQLLDAALKEKENLLSLDTGKKLFQKKIFALKRDIVLLKLFLSTGPRVSEVLNIRLSDIDLKDKSIIIKGKGSRYRTIFFDVEALEKDFLEYINTIKELNLKSDYIFVNIKNYMQLSSRAVQMLLKKYLRKAGLSENITPHILRHTFASISIEKGANIKAVSQILGHSNIQTTLNIYTHLSNEHIREVIKLCNPLSNKIIPLEERVDNRKKSVIFLNKTG